MNGRTIALGEKFFEQGDVMRIPDPNDPNTFLALNLNYEDIKAPPLHPNCRCTIIGKVDPKILDELVPPKQQIEGSPFSAGEIAEEEPLNFGSLNECVKAKIEGDGKGIYKCEETEKRSENTKSYYRSCKNMTDFEACSMVRREVMAYELDKLLDVGLVPETVFKTSKRLGTIGSCQSWIDDFITSSESKYSSNFKKIFEELPIAERKSMVANASVYDDLIGSIDRHSQNFGYDKKTGKMIFIDNGASFTHTPEKAWNGTFVEMGGRGIINETFDYPETVRTQEEYIARSRILGLKSLENKKIINDMFKKNGLGQLEIDKFWERASAMSEGKFYEYKQKVLKELEYI